MNALDELAKGDIILPSPPNVAIRILDASKKEDVCFDELAEIISSDPALAAKVLRAVNSSFYALPQKIDNLGKALSILGLKAVKNLALSFVIVNSYRSSAENEFDFNLFWKRSVTAAVASSLTSTIINCKNDDAFVVGLLQDIGAAAMSLCRPDDYLKVLNEKKISGSPVEVVEKHIFGFDHQELGSEVLKVWGLPESIYMPIRYHHKNNDFPDEYELIIDTLYLSDKFSSVYHGSHGSEKFEAAESMLRNKYQKSQKEIYDLIDLVAEKSVEIFSLFEIELDMMKPYSQLLQEANEELGKINLSYEQLLVKFKESENRAVKIARRLKTVNEQLRIMALRDGLTGLYNHRYFQESLDKEVKRAIRYRRPLSLIMFDLDYFKKVNDSYGHDVGDIVLKRIGKLAQKIARENDIWARYGGEEFVVIAPETDLQGGKNLAERIRKAVEDMEILTDSVTINVTISLGVVIYLPGKKTITKTYLLKVADSALYNSKRNGRNKVTIVKLSASQTALAKPGKIKTKKRVKK